MKRRIDLELEELAKNLGWTAEKNVLDTMEPVPEIPKYPLTFILPGSNPKLRRIIWKDKKQWVSAAHDLDNPNQYTDRKVYEGADLQKALEDGAGISQELRNLVKQGL